MLDVEKFIKSLDRNSVKIELEETQRDLKKYLKKIVESEYDENGHYVPKYNMILLNIPTIPKTLQRKGGQSASINRYKEYLRSNFEKHSKALSRLKNKQIFLHLIMYLDKKSYSIKDVDNFAKYFLDVMKEFIGDDKNIQLLILEKKEIKSSEIKDRGQLEQFLVFIAEASFGKVLLV